MRILLDTNIIIHREAQKVIDEDVGVLFRWLDKIKAEKCIHPITVQEIEKHIKPETVETMKRKMSSYHILQTIAPFSGDILEISDKFDANENDVNDSKILNEVLSKRVGILISEDRKIHKKASILGISEKVFTIDDFLSKITSEHPDLTDYKVLSVKKIRFGEIQLQNDFFNSFREDYNRFDDWFLRKSDEEAYICLTDKEDISAFLYIKVEDKDENYSDITPAFSPKKRLKIGTLKVSANGYKIGERFLKIIFDNALKQKVEEIYVTVFNKNSGQERLISLFEEWGFEYHGEKRGSSGVERVFVRSLDKSKLDCKKPKKSYPRLSPESDVYITPIYPEYHTELFPDSILNTESPSNFVENEPHRNAISKVFISRSFERGMEAGDRIIFYRTGEPGKPAIHTGVATTVGVVESVITDIPSEEKFIDLCRKRSVFSDDELKNFWNYNKKYRPFIVNFLFVASLPRRPNLKWLNENNIIPDIKDMPRGFRKITEDSFKKIVFFSFSPKK